MSTRTSRRPAATPTAWRDSLPGRAAYLTARNEAQAKADATGFDHGIEANDIFKEWRVFMLPRRESRFGHEARCEVVSCTRLSACQKGHGPA
jgi:hypothetical protein